MGFRAKLQVCSLDSQIVEASSLPGSMTGFEAAATAIPPGPLQVIFAAYDYNDANDDDEQEDHQHSEDGAGDEGGVEHAGKDDDDEDVGAGDGADDDGVVMMRTSDLYQLPQVPDSGWATGFCPGCPS